MDIVERLRDLNRTGVNHVSEAADEIEALRARVAELESELRSETIAYEAQIIDLEKQLAACEKERDELLRITKQLGVNRD